MADPSRDPIRRCKNHQNREKDGDDPGDHAGQDAHPKSGRAPDLSGERRAVFAKRLFDDVGTLRRDRGSAKRREILFGLIPVGVDLGCGRVTVGRRRDPETPKPPFVDRALV